MSAFLFRASPESIRTASDESLQERRARIAERLKDAEWDKLKQCTFDFDEAYGLSATAKMIEIEVDRRTRGALDEPTRVVGVPGYNP